MTAARQEEEPWSEVIRLREEVLDLREQVARLAAKYRAKVTQLDAIRGALEAFPD